MAIKHLETINPAMHHFKKRKIDKDNKTPILR